MKTYEKMTGVEIAKQIAGSPVGLQNTRSKHWTLWKGRHRPKRKSSISVSRAGCGGAPATPEVMVPTGEKVTVRMRERERERKQKLWMIVIQLDLLAP
jgi:hypothetical protein